MSTPEIRQQSAGRGGLTYREMEESVELSHIAHEDESDGRAYTK